MRLKFDELRFEVFSKKGKKPNNREIQRPAKAWRRRRKKGKKEK